MSDNDSVKLEDVARGMLRTRWEAALWAVFAVGGYLMTLDFDEPHEYFKLGPAFWPQLLFIGVGVFAVVLFVSTYLADARREGRLAAKAVGETMLDQKVRLTGKLIGFFLFPVLWVYAMHKMGFLLTAPFFIAAFLWLIGVRRWFNILAFTVVFHGSLVLLFYKLIFTPLPMGAGWFHSLNGRLIALFQ